MQSEICEQTSYGQLVQEIIGGSIRRHTFTQWELELLFDLQTCRVRKSSRPDVLRRYLRAVQQQFSKGATSPLRLSEFIEVESGKRPMPEAASPSGAQPAVDTLL